MNVGELEKELGGHVSRILDLYKRREQLEFNKMTINKDLEIIAKQIGETRAIIDTLQFVKQTDGFVNLPNRPNTPNVPNMASGDRNAD